jgi:hypothetical protein
MHEIEIYLSVTFLQPTCIPRECARFTHVGPLVDRGRVCMKLAGADSQGTSWSQCSAINTMMGTPDAVRSRRWGATLATSAWWG